MIEQINRKKVIGIKFKKKKKLCQVGSFSPKIKPVYISRSSIRIFSNFAAHDKWKKIMIWFNKSKAQSSKCTNSLNNKNTKEYKSQQ